MDRRELFTKISISSNQENKLIRPPYFDNEDLFNALCVTCDGRCKDVCETSIIKIGEDKTPYLDFTVGGCTYCDECAKICPYGVLKLENQKQINVKIMISKQSCLSWQQTMCFSCKDPCIDNAINFENGIFYPSITDNCTSCGFCIKYCPTNAIEILYQ